MNLTQLKSKEIVVPVATLRRYNEVTDPLMRNVREPSSYNRPELKDSILNIGLTDPIWGVYDGTTIVIDGKEHKRITPLKGFSRLEVLNELNAEFPQGTTLDDGEKRRFDQVKVKLVDTTDQTTMMILKMDHGMHKNLTRVEVFNAFSQLHTVQTKEKDMVVILRGGIEVNYPPDSGKKLPEPPSPTDAEGKAKTPAIFAKEYAKYQENLLKHYKGVIQTFKNAANSPDVLRDAYVCKLKGEQKWPLNDELRDGLKIYEEEVTTDTTGSFCKKTPGPKFNAWWENITAVKAESIANGEGNKPKSVSMMNAQQVRELEKQLSSILLRRILAIQLRKVATVNVPILDQIALRLETLLTEEEKMTLSAMGVVEVPKTEEETPAETAPPESAAA